jgi:hypothetical protein
VAYTDDDILFLPGWLDAHLKIMETYPKVGLVTGFYIRSHLRYATQSIEAFARQPGVEVKRGMLIPPELEQHYIENMGRTSESYQQEVSGLEDIQFTYRSLNTLASAGHHQFVTPRQLMLNLLPGWDSNLMGRMVELEEAVDRGGYLRLSTATPVTRLLGNVISAGNAAEAKRLGLSAQAGSTADNKSMPGNQLLKIPLLRRLALGIYNRLHIMLNS